MAHLPVLTELKVIGYEMFPGNPPGSGIIWSFQPGVTVIAGINGLGKTTLLTMILRALTGPYDLASEGGAGSLHVVLPENPVPLRQKNRRLFLERVTDGAEHAKLVLSATIGESAITIVRRLKDLSLEELTINDQVAELQSSSADREVEFQSRLTELIGLGSFVDVLLILHHVVLFSENRPGALWDPNAQRQLLRALFLDQADASRVAALERELQSADSQARNVHARITSTKRRRDAALAREAGKERVVAELLAQQKILEAEQKEASRLEEELEQLNEGRHRARLAHERAKIDREEATGAIERLKYSSILTHFPSMDETTRFVLSRIMADGRCLVCSSSAVEKQRELEEQIAQGQCPICGSEPEVQDNIFAQHEFAQAKLDQQQSRAKQARKEETTQFGQLQNLNGQYEQTLRQLDDVRRSIRGRQEKNKQLETQLPDATTSKEHESVLKNLELEHSEWRKKRSSRLRELRTLFAENRDAITGKTSELVSAFADLIKVLVIEDTRLVQISAEPRYMQAPGKSGERVEVPAYAAEMKASSRPTYIRRGDPSEVSESQRELIDLAFRLALVEVLGGSCTFVMETPEASLDGIAMERVGRALGLFSMKGENRLIATSNLTNAGIITSLFEESATEAGLASRLQRVLNLLELASPNRALEENRDRYEALLSSAVLGADP